MLISRKRDPVNHPPLFMNNIPLKCMSTHKHLGLTFSDTCDWTNHITNITDAAWTRLNLLCTLKFKINRHALEKIYFAFIRPVLEYSDSVWDNATNDSKKQLEATHIEAARIITGATKLCSTEKLLSDLGWDSLQNRRNKHKLTILYKILNGLTPEYLQSILPPLVQNTTNYNLSNSNILRSIHANTNLFYNSFFPSTIRAWNGLSEDIKKLTICSSFQIPLKQRHTSTA